MALLFLVLAACAPEPAGPPPAAVVAAVVDGDTVILEDGRRLRYLGIDTPELTAAAPRERHWAQLARQVNTALVQGQRVRLEYDRERYDQYDRLLAYVFAPGEQMVNAVLVRQGLARVRLLPPNLRYEDLLITLQRQAIAARRGLWQELPAATAENYRGNRQTRRFHRPTCPAARRIAPANRITFATPLAAYQEGYFPCRLCQPD